MSKKNDDIFSLRNLAIEKQRARKDLKENLSETKERMKPSNLIKTAKGKAIDRVQRTGENAVQGVKANPGITASVAAAATLFAFRKPLTKYFTARRNAQNTKE